MTLLFDLGGYYYLYTNSNPYIINRLRLRERVVIETRISMFLRLSLEGIIIKYVTSPNWQYHSDDLISDEIINNKALCNK